VRRARAQPCDIRRLLLRMAAPQDEDLWRRIGRDRRDDRVGERLPPLALMRRRLPRLDRQAIVEQQHALFGPMSEIAVRRPRDAEVALHFLVDIDEARRGANPRLYRKAQAMRLLRPVIRILPQDDDADVARRRRVERGEPVARARIDRLALVALGGKKRLERRHIGLLEFAAYRREPVGMEFDLSHARASPERRKLVQSLISAPPPRSSPAR
jgi:hypothetical protein